METNLWQYRSDVGNDRANMEGMTVEAVDGKVGKVDEVCSSGEFSYLLVDSGPLGLGKSRIVPAGIIASIDVDDEVLHLDRTKAEIKDAPDYSGDRHDDTAHLEALSRHYGVVKT